MLVVRCGMTAGVAARHIPERLRRDLVRSQIPTGGHITAACAIGTFLLGIGPLDLAVGKADQLVRKIREESVVNPIR